VALQYFAEGAGTRFTRGMYTTGHVAGWSGRCGFLPKRPGRCTSSARWTLFRPRAGYQEATAGLVLGAGRSVGPRHELGDEWRGLYADTTTTYSRANSGRWEGHGCARETRGLPYTHFPAGVPLPGCWEQREAARGGSSVRRARLMPEDKPVGEPVPVADGPAAGAGGREVRPGPKGPGYKTKSPR